MIHTVDPDAIEVEAVFLDAGFTLVHPRHGLGEVYADVTRTFGADVPPQAFVETARAVFTERKHHRLEHHLHETSDARDRELWTEITGAIHERIPAMADVPFFDWFDALWERFGRPEEWALYDDALPTIRALRAHGLPVGIVSNWDSRLVGILQGLGLDREVDFALISSQVGWRKPHARIFEAAVERAGADPARTLHVGDDFHEDILAAEQVGLRPIWIDRTHGPAPVPHPDADHPRITTLHDLAHHL